MKVLGIDPGSETLGWGVVEGTNLKYKLVEFGTIKSSPKMAFSKRLLKIFDGVADLIGSFSPMSWRLKKRFTRLMSMSQ